VLSKLKELFWHIVVVLVAVALEGLAHWAYDQHLLSANSFWVATGSLIVALFIAFQIWLYFWKKKRPVFILIPAFDDNYFFASLLQSLLAQLQQRNLVGIPISHQGSQSVAGQKWDFNEILRHKHDYAAGIIAGLAPGVGTTEVNHFLTNFAKPVVFVDAVPFSQESAFPDKTAYVGFDDKMGGQLAADGLLKGSPPNLTAPRILVIGGQLKKERQQAFGRQIKTARPNAEVVVNDDGKFSRDEARRIAEQYFETSDHQNRYDGVFCTNDEMALGVLDATRKLPPDVTRPWIVGYDAIPEALRAIQNGAIKNTIVQDTRELAERGSEIVADLLGDRNNLFGKVTQLEPHLYKR
jgi:ribose transport system substrate-binding protein